ncbi:MAG TPA: hypothetical protein VII94_03870 [Candidatus Saccharimonadales bacterium]
MEQYNKNKDTEPVAPLPQSEEALLQESEASNSQTDRVKHSSEQSSANIFSHTNPHQQSTQDDSVLPTVVDDSAVTDSTRATKGSKKINITDGIIASDKDLIEKAWVDKAKAIIEDAQGNPHKKNANLTIVKDQYKSVRFNKLVSER